MVGGAGNDLFILAHRLIVSGTRTYKGDFLRFNGKNGISDYSYIVDFVPGEDKIQIGSDVYNYSLRRVENYVYGAIVNETNIYYLDDLIARVNGDIELNQDYFTFVSPQFETADYSTAKAAVFADLNSDTATITDDAQGNSEKYTLFDTNKLSGGNFDDKLTGNVQENILAGNKGNDSLWGGAGNDNLRGDEGADVLDGGEGIDRAEHWTAKAGVVADLTVGTATIIDSTGNPEVDTLISIEQLYGSDFNDQLVGDDLSNALIGRDGDDTLLGGKGGDILEGGDGTDSFAFTFPNQGVDRINDFNSTQGDKIQISANGFGGNLIPGSLDAEQFVLGTASVDGDDRFIFNQDTGRLSFDADGSGILEAIEIATFYNNIVLSHSDIFIV